MGEYVYCITKRMAVSVPVKGIEGSGVYGIPFKELTAVASEAPFKDYEPSEENVKIHRNVISQILREHSVLPVAFGMVFKDRKILLNNIRNVYHLLIRSLILVKNQIELGVKVVFPEAEGMEKWCNGKSMEEFREECDSRFAEALGGLALRSVKGRLFSGRLVVNRSFLVDRNHTERFSSEVARLSDECKPLKVKYTGPWAPYNFVDIRILGRGRGG